MSGSFQITKTELLTSTSEIGPGDRPVVPDELLTWLADLALLHAVPSHYLVPDPALLPPDSIRLVVVDRTLVGKLLDGALAAAALGGGDLVLTARFRNGVVDRVYEELAWRAYVDTLGGNLPPTTSTNPKQYYLDGWDGEGTIAGVIIRSELVERYPSMTVRASVGGQPLGCVRRERLAPSLMLALFHGLTVPDRIELQEPDEGVRFGVEPAGDGFKVDGRDPEGKPFPADQSIPIPVRADGDGSVLDLTGPAWSPIRVLTLSGATAVGRCLQQTPFVQIIGSGPRPAAWEPKP